MEKTNADNALRGGYLPSVQSNSEIEVTIQKVLQWSRDKGITGAEGKGTIEAQAKKVLEEAGEAHAAALNLVIIRDILNFIRDLLNSDKSSKIEDPLSALLVDSMQKVVDGIGDNMVTLIILAEMIGVSIHDCLQCAYSEIQNRKGKMINGEFVKSENLPEP